MRPKRSRRPVGELRLLSERAVGPEYPAAIISILTQYYATLQRNVLHTAVTRGKRPEEGDRNRRP